MRLLGADAKASQPIYINATTNRAEAVPWEALYSDPPGFLTLDRRWPIARLSGSDTVRPPKVFAPPIRIMAIISAKIRPNATERDALRCAAM